MQRNKLWFIPLAVCALSVGAAHAESGTANASVITPLTLTESSTLEFGQLSSSAASGTVVIDSADGRTVTGGATAEGGTFRSGAWAVSGEASTAYTITLPSSDVTLTSGGNNMTVNTFTDDKSGSSTTDGAGADTFKVGATLTVGINQASGTYTGTYDVTVAYQ